MKEKVETLSYQLSQGSLEEMKKYGSKKDLERSQNEEDVEQIKQI